MNRRPFRSLAPLAVMLSASGCYVEPIQPGWFPLPAHKDLLFSPADLGFDYEPIEIAAPAVELGPPGLDLGPLAAQIGGPPPERTIYGWFIPAADAPATVLINHGAVVNRSGTAPFYTMLHELGYNVVVYDYAGFGDSPGPANLATLTPDADAMLDYVLTRSESAGLPVVLYGISLGTAPTLAQSARAPAGVVAAIVDGSFGESLPPATYLAVGVIPLPTVLDSVYTAHPDLDPTRHVAEITIPKLFVHSPQDSVTPIEGAQHLYDLARAPKQWCEVFGGHAFSWALDRGYAACVQAFLAEVLSDQAEDARKP